MAVQGPNPGRNGTCFLAKTGACAGPTPGARHRRHALERPKAGRNDPCPCGSGKKRHTLRETHLVDET
ncbi:MAG: SEC-C metal-binding domain-containing protein [Pseudomonadota bacterium]